MSDVTLLGHLNPSGTYNADFFDPSRDTENELSCKIPERFIIEGCPLADMGIDSGRTGRLTGVNLKNNVWYYRFNIDKRGGSIQCGTALLDKLFAPILPAVAVNILRFYMRRPNQMIYEAIERITAQQPKERTAVWMVGEQLKDMIRAEPQLAELIVQELEVESLSLKKCEAKIKAFADAHKAGASASSCVTPLEAERIIREFYGLPGRDEAPEHIIRPKILNLEDFL